MQYYYNPEVKYLLLTEAYHKEKILYAHNSKPFEAPMIGRDPPHFIVIRSISLIIRLYKVQL